MSKHVCKCEVPKPVVADGRVLCDGCGEPFDHLAELRSAVGQLARRQGALARQVDRTPPAPTTTAGVVAQHFGFCTQWARDNAPELGGVQLGGSGRGRPWIFPSLREVERIARRNGIKKKGGGGK